MCRVSRHIGSHLIIKILIFLENPRSYASLSMDEKQGKTIKVCYGVSP